MSRKALTGSPIFWAGAFALLNVLMYLTIQRFWIGGSSFLPLIGELGADGMFLFAFIVNMGVIIGAFVAAKSQGEFILRFPVRGVLWKAVVGGFCIGIGFALAPGTCTTVFVTGMPMLSVSSFLSGAGIFIGAFIAYKIFWKG
ncbi:MAG: YeeE/YedE thiosulfate transporter family protein [Sedimenticola sp.]